MISFEGLNVANATRAPEWGGKPASIEFKAIELGGEAGECLNKVKKYLRNVEGMVGGVNLDTTREEVADELGDVVICADLLAEKLGINLGEAVMRKFNKTSDKHGFTTKFAIELAGDGQSYRAVVETGV